MVRFPGSQMQHQSKKMPIKIVVLLIIPFFSTLAYAQMHDAIARRAKFEYKAAIHLKPDLEHGRQIYQTCMVCHGAEGWGSRNGMYPQIAGQLKSVIIKQLDDIQTGNRGNPMMVPFTQPDILPNAQAIADVAGYISQLPMTPFNGKGHSMDLKRGEQLYKDNCVDCHGKRGEGSEKDHIPLIQGQHYNYLYRQFRWIQIGRRRNADDDMIKQIQKFHGSDIDDIMDYVSRIKPPAAKLARPDWINPDFPYYVHDIMPARQVDVELPEERNYKMNGNRVQNPDDE